MRCPYAIAAMGLGLDAVIVAAVLGSLSWLGLGCFAIVCGVFDALRNPMPSLTDAPHELD
jgi:ABC-type uncharacterized transport system permease subunit